MKKTLFAIVFVFLLFIGGVILAANTPSNFIYRGIKVTFTQSDQRYVAIIKNSISVTSDTVVGIKSAIDGIIGVPAANYGVYLAKAVYGAKPALSYKVKAEDKNASYSLRIVKYIPSSGTEKTLKFEFVKNEQVVSVPLTGLKSNECIKAYATRLNKELETYGSKSSPQICPLSAPIPILYTVNASDYRKIIVNGKVSAPNNNQYKLAISVFRVLPEGMADVPVFIQESSVERFGTSEFSLATSKPLDSGRYSVSITATDKKTGKRNSSRNEIISVISPKESDQFVLPVATLTSLCTREKSVINKQLPLETALKIAATIGKQVGLSPDFILSIAAHESKVNKDVGEKFFVKNCNIYGEDTEEHDQCDEYYNILSSVNLGRQFAPASAPKWAEYADGRNGGAMGISQFKPLTWKKAVNEQNGLENVAVLLGANWANMSPWNPCVGMIVSASHLAHLKEYIQQTYPEVTSEECLHKYITQFYYSGGVYTDYNDEKCGIYDEGSYSKRSYFKRKCIKAIYNGIYPDSRCYGTDYDYSIFYTLENVSSSIAIYKKK